MKLNYKRILESNDFDAAKSSLADNSAVSNDIQQNVANPFQKLQTQIQSQDVQKEIASQQLL